MTSAQLILVTPAVTFPPRLNFRSKTGGGRSMTGTKGRTDTLPSFR